VLMTTAKLLLFRLLNVSIGRIALGDRAIRWMLKRLLIREGSESTYTASGSFFDICEIQQSNGMAPSPPETGDEEQQIAWFSRDA
jgi:hypothetical protein